MDERLYIGAPIKGICKTFSPAAVIHPFLHASFSAVNAVSFLLAWGAFLEERDFDNKMSALHYAVISGSTPIVRKLLLAGADKNVTDNENLTPL